tara:strand:+ start:146 stop:433 length:288 start_codon:yes stop_codon:yes gene_type:complete
MKIYTKIILDKNNKVLKEEFFEYSGVMALAGIHYDFKSQKGNKLMEKQAKRERKLAERKAKRLAKEGPKKEEDKKPELDPNTALSLDFLTNPNKE